jgi:hypothetical protein
MKYAQNVHRIKCSPPLFPVRAHVVLLVIQKMVALKVGRVLGFGVQSLALLI